MSNYIKVGVSPFYRGMGWFDEPTGIKFQSKGLMNTYTIDKKEDLSGIQKQIHLNNLILLDGEFDTEYVPEDIQGLKDENTSLKNQVSSLNNQVSSLENEVADLQAQLEDALEGGVQPQSIGEPDSSLYTQEEAEAMTVSEIEGELDRLEIEYTSSWNKAQKVALLVGQPKE